MIEGLGDGPVILDTSAFSVLMRGGQDAAALRPFVTGRPWVVSFITVGELLKGAVKAGWGERRMSDLEQRIASVGVVPGTIGVARCYARLAAKFGSSKGENDLWIAACAMLDQATVPLVTTDSDFDEIAAFAGITLLRPG